MDALQKFFDWAEHNHYLTSTKEMINAASKQVLETETELAALKKLVRENRIPTVSNLPKYPLILVHAVDWHQYNGQHDPKSGEPYRTIKGWMVGFLLEETEDHLAIVHTAFDTGDVRYVVVVPKCAVISQRILPEVKRIMEDE
jgi:hypothetical protein